MLTREDSAREAPHASPAIPIVAAIEPGDGTAAKQVAAILDAPLETVVVVPLCVAGTPIGAAAEHDVAVVAPRLDTPVTAEDLVCARRAAHREIAILCARRGRAPGAPLTGARALLVVERNTTPEAAHAAARALRQRGVSRIFADVSDATPPTEHALADEGVAMLRLRA